MPEMQSPEVKKVAFDGLKTLSDVIKQHDEGKVLIPKLVVL